MRKKFGLNAEQEDPIENDKMRKASMVFLIREEISTVMRSIKYLMPDLGITEKDMKKFIRLMKNVRTEGKGKK